MRMTSFAVAVFCLMLFPCLTSGEEQVTDRSGRVVEIRQQRGTATYAYDGYRNPIYVGIGIQGGKGALDYRDQHGVHVGVGGTAGTLPWAVRGTWGSK